MRALLRRLLKGDIASIRAAIWARRAAVRANVALRENGLESLDLPAVPAVPLEAGRGVSAVLARRHDSCLVRATVRQAWWHAHGDDRVLVIGVTKPGPDFSAHAWLEGDAPCHSEGFTELLRHPVA